MKSDGLYAQSYTFTHTTATYSNMSGGTVVSTPYWDDFTVMVVPLSFPVLFFGASFDTVYTTGNFEGFTYDPNNGFGDYEFGTYEYSGMSDNSNNTATVSYHTTGSAPNRIFIIQTKDAGFYDDQTEQDYVNFQVWFYETSGIVEIHFGPNSILNPNSWLIPGSSGPGIILAQTAVNYIALSGPATNPNATTTFVNYTVTGTPPDGMVYRFTPTSTGIEENDANSMFSLYPNPGNGSFNVRLKEFSTGTELFVYDLTGKMVYRTDVHSETMSIKLSLPAGLYSVVVKGGERISRRNLVIQ